MQPHGSKYFPRRPPKALGVKRLKLNFFRTLSCCISKGNANGTINKKHIKVSKGAKIRNLTLIEGLCSTPGWTKGVGSKVKLNFSEHGHVAYQIKGNHMRSNMQHGSKYNAHSPPPTTLGVKRLKFNFFRTWSYCI